MKSFVFFGTWFTAHTPEGMIKPEGISTYPGHHFEQPVNYSHSLNSIYGISKTSPPLVMATTISFPLPEIYGKAA